MRLPINNVTAQSSVPGLNQGGTSTGLGNLTLFVKHTFFVDPKSGSLVTGGLAVSPSTGTTRFADAIFLGKNNNTTIQPFVAYLFRADRFYFQGFSSVSVPDDPSQPTLLYNDLAIGYFLYRDDTFQNFITAVVPTLEAHINTPITHRDPYNPLDPFGSPDIVNITSGLNTRFRESSVLTMGVVVPVTGPRPFSIEGSILFNYYFGQGRRRQTPPPVISG